MSYDYENEYSTRFDHRREKHVENFKELYNDVSNDIWEFPINTRMLLNWEDIENEIAAFRKSIVNIWLQACGCYIFGYFEGCIILVGATVERILKLEYQQVKGDLPEGLTLGRIIGLDWTGTRVDEYVISRAKICKGERDDRVHALLEHLNPELAWFGGDRGINVINEFTYEIEPFRGEAKKVMKSAWEIIERLYLE